MDGKETIEWWGYIHVDGTIHLKRFFSPEDIREAESSDFVKSIVGPFEAETRHEAAAVFNGILNTLSKAIK